MPTYKVQKIYKYSMTVEVDAEDEKAAEQAAILTDGEHNEDDHLYDVIVSDA